MAGFAMMTACSGDKKNGNAEAEPQDQEVVADDSQADADNQDADGEAADDASNVVCTPAEAALLNLQALYENGDFHPAATTIFVDNVADETAGELPSKWDLKEGSAEVGQTDSAKYIALSGGNAVLFPITGSGNSFLTESYTMEFEFLFGQECMFYVQHYDAEEAEVSWIHFWPDQMEWFMNKKDDEGMYGSKDELRRLLNPKGWNHFAMSYDNGNVKLFINGKRLSNLPNIKPSSYFTITGVDANGESHFIRNIRIAK